MKKCHVYCPTVDDRVLIANFLEQCGEELHSVFREDISSDKWQYISKQGGDWLTTRIDYVEGGRLKMADFIQAINSQI